MRREREPKAPANAGHGGQGNPVSFLHAPEHDEHGVIAARQTAWLARCILIPFQGSLETLGCSIRRTSTV
jgi:hypothetical protein